MKKNYWLALIFIVLLVIIVWSVRKPSSPNQIIENNKNQMTIFSSASSSLTVQEKTSLIASTSSVLETGKTYSAILHTSDGDITVSLSASATPITVNNFIYLAKKGFYNNTVFHRVIKDFMIQGGDPLGNGTGGPNYRFNDESFQGSYDRGVLAMANAGPNTNGSQFFIMHQAVPLQPNYVIFGKVTSGMDVVDKIATATVVPSLSGEASKPSNPVTINSIDIITE